MGADPGHTTHSPRVATLAIAATRRPAIQTAVVNYKFRALERMLTVNLGFDINKTVTVTAAGGVVFTLDPDNGRVTAGVQGTAGLILKFDEFVPDPRRQ